MNFTYALNIEPSTEKQKFFASVLTGVLIAKLVNTTMTQKTQT